MFDTIKKRLSAKFIFVIVVVLSMAMSGTAFFSASYNNKLVAEQRIMSAEALGNFIALISIEAILTYDFITLENYVSVAGSQEDIFYGVIRSAKGDIIASYLKTEREKMIANAYIEKLIKISQFSRMEDITSMAFNIVYDGEVIGVVELGISQKRISELKREIFLTLTIANLLIITILSISIYLVFRVNVLKPVNALRDSFRKAAAGDLDHLVDVVSHDELGNLAESFNKMTLSLKESTKDKDRVVDELRERNQQLAEATKAKSTFLANMSHELRTPLNAIIGYSEMLQEDCNDIEEDQIEDLQKIQFAGRHLLTLVNDVLDLSKIEAGKMELFLEDFQVKRVITEVASMVQPLAEKKKLRVTIDTDSTVDTMRGDVTKIKQAIFNLLSNSIKFTAEGDIKLWYEVVRENGIKWILFNVSDTGIGMTESQLNNLFNEFVQADASTTRKYGGTGLGLSITKKFCNMLGGEITAKSEYGCGSLFTIRLPLIGIDRLPQSHDIGKQIGNRRSSISKVQIVTENTEEA